MGAARRRRSTRPEVPIGALLAHLPLLRGAAGAELERLAAGTTRRRLKRGEALFREGERLTGFYVVVHGRVALRKGDRLADVIGDGRSFGEAVMFLGKPAIVSAAALGDALVLHVAKETVLAEIERNPAFARRIIAALAAKLEAAMRELETYSLASGGRRFAAWLLRSAQDDPTALTLPAPKRAIASRLNLSAEHLSRVMRELSDEGLIEVHGRRVRIPDPDKLRAWTQQPGGRA